MEQLLRILIVDDVYPDAELSARQIAAGGYRCVWRRVETESGLREELRKFAPDLILSDFTLPHYDGWSALELAAREAPGTPFIFVSGSLGEARGAEALTRGAVDYVPKNDRARLVSAVSRALSITAAPVPGPTPGDRIRRLTRALGMLSGVRTAATSLRSRAALLKEACRIVHDAKQYDYSFIVLEDKDTYTAHASAWAGAGAARCSSAQFRISKDEAGDSSVTGRVLRTGQPVVCLDIDAYSSVLSEHESEAAAPGSSLISLPLLVEGESIGALTVGMAKHAHISEQEILLLEEFAAQVSNALGTIPNAPANSAEAAASLAVCA